MEKNRPNKGGFLYILTKNRPRVVGEPHDPNFRSVCYSAIFSIESQANIPLLFFPETPTGTPIVYIFLVPAVSVSDRPNFEPRLYSGIFSIESRTALLSPRFPNLGKTSFS
jgi:hypothetical protein